ncbi:ubiquitin-conjugating enzyme E2Z [Neurospora crassa OR74A]|uniref:Ubiquitin-conjugating enzyme E2Z n=2 Tax=Neurospora crassa (strain ATCC 24698 / 74-OR23-1A / CBS 708.71 / DSM 1257 / FGSC 987) TaxID=367110 RepID=V5IQI3_NEUCR|nr:ubiquitin-conjugating enzyme E2Z [Neurospora crassa OR74A]ESA43955.1 ubiquitin-conjugating enzyme E2Z [Neurospora crassa OR74A]|eukprot:XP_011393002.1 ubiquitin-conjugating enzyme E2Z [Neurospora crassa OR74A]
MDQSVFRITKELSDLQKDSDLSLAVACRDVDVRNVKAMIIGPHETPYEFGFFEFAFVFNKDYPRRSPQVQATTTNDGRTRFNPNIYANGKVCLSILGTWRGERGEQWSAAQGLESILLSIQSLMSMNPYENEPGFEDAKEAQDQKNQKDYIQKIRHETIRISVVHRLEEYLGINPDGTFAPTSVSGEIASLGSGESDMDILDEESSVPFEPFKDLCKRRFLWYYDSYLAAVEKGKSEVKDNQSFVRMPFESLGNGMEGKFNYTELEKRLKVIKAALDAETEGWAAEGLQAKAQETTVAVNLQRQFEQVVEHFKRRDLAHSIELEDGNPFVWLVTYFGKPMTNLDGGLFRIRLCFSARFPEEQPRARFETKIFHHRIAADGTPCYFAPQNRREDVRTHLEAIIDALEEESPPYDPRTLVNPEAFKLFWGSADDRKMYNRRLRRSVQQSMEEF